VLTLFVKEREKFENHLLKIRLKKIIIQVTSSYMKMSVLGLVEYFSMAEALGIIATMLIVLYFSRKQTQALSVDIET
jgi:hypothetical protein